MDFVFSCVYMSQPQSPDKFKDSLQPIMDMANHAPVGMQIYNAAGHSIYTNPQHTLIFGGPPPPEMCVLTDEQVKAAGSLHLIHRAFAGEPAVLPLLWYDPRDIPDLTEEGKNYVQAVAKRAAIETHMIPIFGQGKTVTHVMFIFKDVTGEIFMRQERERALKERDDAKTLIQNILDQTQAVIYIKDLDGKFIFVNGQFCRIFNMTADQVIGRTNHQLFPKHLADEFHKNDLHVQETRSHTEIEEVAVHADGKAHTYLSLKFPVEDSTGALIGVCGISTDITQSRSLEQELNRVKRVEAVGFLASGIAHDFNNVLGTILLVSDTLLIRGSAKKAEWQAAIEAIKRSAQSAALLTRQLLTFGSQQKSEPRNINLGSVIGGTKDILKNALGEDIRFTVKIGRGLWPVHIDRVQVDQILTNLCFNARDAMPKGGSLKILVRNLPGASRDRVELAVSDNGTGIASEALEHIFEPFFTTKMDGQHTGLGLATVHRIVEGAGGTIAVESVAGKGSTFRLSFPRASGGMAADGVSENFKSHAYRGRETILLVEDQALLRNVTGNLLRERGYAVIEANGAKAALGQWKRVAKKVDLIVTDIVMPGMSGLEMIQKMKLGKAKAGRPTKALFVSAYSDKKLSDYEFNRDAIHFIEKPYTAVELLTKMREILGHPAK
jgi:PAS domain S-box-containing protein